MNNKDGGLHGLGKTLERIAEDASSLLGTIMNSEGHGQSRIRIR